MRTGCEPTRFGNEAKTIIHGDALAELKKIPAESVDLIFADPPYNIGKNFDGLIEAWKEDLFIDWLFEVIAECHRVLKKQGSMYIMNSTENMPFIDLQCRKLFTIKSRIVWSYDSSGVQAKKHYGSMYEPILMMVKDAKNYTFNGDAILVEAKTGSQRALIDYRKNPPQPYNHQKVPGKGVVEATLMAVRMRLRPILMTSLAFILGVLPLAISNGAGSGAQNAVGIPIWFRCLPAPC
ncbi:adenine-specific DNA-methyltransferase [Escherichia coli]|nr:adenine-specific DNA-methyltransferase [Escherichia coli]